MSDNASSSRDFVCNGEENTLAWLRKREQETCPRSDYLEKVQKRGFHSEERELVVQWMLEVADTLDLGHNVSSLAICLLDRTLSRFSADPSLVQVIALTCLMVTAKLLEPSPPSLRNFCDCSPFNPEEVCQAERLVLAKVDWRLRVPTPSTFLPYLLPRSILLDPHAMALCHSIFDAASMDASLLSFLPSVVAAGAITLAHLTYGFGSNPSNKLSATLGVSQELVEKCTTYLRDTTERFHTFELPVTRNISSPATVLEDCSMFL